MKGLLKRFFKNNIYANYLVGRFIDQVSYVIYQRYINFDKDYYEMDPVMTWETSECKYGIANLFFDYGESDQHSVLFTLKTSIWNTYDYVMYKFVEDEVNAHIEFLLKLVDDAESFVEAHEARLLPLRKGAKTGGPVNYWFTTDEYELSLSTTAPGKDFCLGVGSFDDDLYPLSDDLLSIIGIYFSGAIHNYLNSEHNYRPTFGLIEKYRYTLDKELFLGDTVSWEDYKSDEDVIQVGQHGKLMSAAIEHASKVFKLNCLNISHIVYNSMSKNCFSVTYGRYGNGLMYSKEFEANGGQTEALYGLGLYDFKKVRLASVKDANSLIIGHRIPLSTHLHGNTIN